MNSVNTVIEITLPKVLNPASIAELNSTWDRIDLNETRLVILKGSSDYFCLGMDICWVSGSGENAFSDAIDVFISFLTGLQAAPCITMAVVEGRATGGGVGICSACDVVVASSASSFQLTEGLLGLIPGIILTPLLYRLSRQQVAKMVFTAKAYSAKEALQMGLVDDVVEKQELEPVTSAWISQLKKCKRQSVADLKEIWSKADLCGENLMHAGAALLRERLKDADIQNRLSNLAFFNKE